MKSIWVCLQEIVLKKGSSPLGFSIVGGSDHASHPFGMDEPGIFISKVGGYGSLCRATANYFEPRDHSLTCDLIAPHVYNSVMFLRNSCNERFFKGQGLYLVARIKLKKICLPLFRRSFAKTERTLNNLTGFALTKD